MTSALPAAALLASHASALLQEIPLFLREVLKLLVARCALARPLLLHPEVGEEVAEREVGVRRLSAHLVGALGLLRLRRQRLKLLQQVGLGAGLGPLVRRQRGHSLGSLGQKITILCTGAFLLFLISCLI